MLYNNEASLVKFFQVNHHMCRKEGFFKEKENETSYKAQRKMFLIEGVDL